MFDSASLSDKNLVLNVNSASLSDNNLVLNVDNNASIDLSQYGGNDQWDIIKTTVIEGNRLGASNLKFYLYLKRKPFYFLLNIVAPTILLSLMSVVVFLLPSHAEEKMGLSITILLAFTVFMLTITDVLPSSSDSVSLLGKIISSNSK